MSAYAPREHSQGRVAAGENRRFQLRRRFLRILALIPLWVCLAAPAQSVTVITSADRSAVPLDRTLLLALFTMRVRQWPDGRPARVFVLRDDSEIHEQFCREILGTYPYVLHNAWERMVYTGTGQAPTVVRSEEEMQDKVRSTIGAIGYMRPVSKTATPPERSAASPSSRNSP